MPEEATVVSYADDIALVVIAVTKHFEYADHCIDAKQLVLLRFGWPALSWHSQRKRWKWSSKPSNTWK